MLSRFQKRDVPSQKWIALQSDEDLEIALKESQKKPVAIFKHSTRCSISSMALQRMIMGEGDMPEKLNMYYLDLLSFRHISNKVEERLKLRHESPQLILVSKGNVIYHSSHHMINTEELLKVFREYA